MGILNILERVFDSLNLNFLNRKNSPSAHVENSPGGVVQQAGRDIQNTLGQKQEPLIDVKENFGVSGGPSGQDFSFQAINNGTAVAVDISAQVTAEGIGTLILSGPVAHRLAPDETSQDIRFKYSGTDLFAQKLTNPRLLFTYRDTSGNEYKTGRELIQTPRADNNFNIGSVPGTFINKPE